MRVALVADAGFTVKNDAITCLWWRKCVSMFVCFCVGLFTAAARKRVCVCVCARRCWGRAGPRMPINFKMQRSRCQHTHCEVLQVRVCVCVLREDAVVISLLLFLGNWVFEQISIWSSGWESSSTNIHGKEGGGFHLLHLPRAREPTNSSVTQMSAVFCFDQISFPKSHRPFCNVSGP